MFFNSHRTNSAPSIKTIFLCSALITGMSASYTNAEELDGIDTLTSCGAQCWPKTRLTESNLMAAHPNDAQVTSCMQTCFTAKTGHGSDPSERLAPEQLTKIKVSAYCGSVCSDAGKSSKKALDFCYAGCLNKTLQSKPKY